MSKIFEPIQRKVNNMIYSLVIAGFLILIFGVLIVWSDFLARLVLGMIIMVISFIFFYGAYKIASIRNDVKKVFKL